MDERRLRAGRGCPGRGRAGAAGVGGCWAGAGEPGAGGRPRAHRRWPGDACRRQQNTALLAFPACPLPVPAVPCPRTRGGRPAGAPAAVQRAGTGRGRRDRPGEGGVCEGARGATAQGPAPAPGRGRGVSGPGRQRGQLSGRSGGRPPPQPSPWPRRGRVPKGPGVPALATADTPPEKTAVGPPGNPLPRRGPEGPKGLSSPLRTSPRAPLPRHVPAQRLPPPAGPWCRAGAGPARAPSPPRGWHHAEQ